MTNDITITLPRLYPMQRQVRREMKRFNVLVCGRRWGKTEFLKDRIVHPLLKGQPVGYFASQYKYLAEVWAAICRTLSPLIKYRNSNDHRLELSTGGVLDMWTMTTPDAGRSRKYALAVVDEAGLQSGLKDIWVTAIRPTLFDLNGGAIFAGTPNGLNDFHSLYQMGGNDNDWASWRRPTHDNPFIDPLELESARHDMPENRYRQEILAEFLDDGAGVFRYINRAAYGAMASFADLDPRREYIIGVDLGKLHDFTVFMVIDRELKRVVWYERLQSDYIIQIEKLCSMVKRLNVTSLVVEDNTGQMFIEALRDKGVRVNAFTTTNKSKTRIIENLAVAFERGDITIPNDDTLINELMAFEAERLPGGAMRYSAPAGYHDDTVMALALAWDAIASSVVWDTTREVVSW